MLFVFSGEILHQSVMGSEMMQLLLGVLIMLQVFVELVFSSHGIIQAGLGRFITHGISPLEWCWLS
jgi:hypothetical protein